MTIDEQIDLRTQEIVKLQIGDLVLTCARLRAANEALRAERPTVTPDAPPEPPPNESP